MESGVLRSADVAKTESGSGEVVIAVSAYGVCQSNLPRIAGAWVANGVPAFLSLLPGQGGCGVR